ncbi:MAG: protein kinase [Polyangiaceae bacterium]|jgi:WD40 repeat protein|nr:protein kinase [Polyangiaceae bacterium]
MEPERPGVSPFEQTALGPSTSDPLAQTQALDPAPQGLSQSGGPVSAKDLSFLRPFGPFTRVEALAEQGAMGLVARGYNGAFDRWELLKFLRSEFAQNPELLRQFQREGRVLAKLSHPNIVQVFAIYALDGRPCLAMEFLEGESLQAHARRLGGKLPVERCHELLLAAARGLAAAHEVGLLHRDLKPENLFVLAEKKSGTPGLKLIDFGLATADRNRHDVSHDPTLIAATSGGTPLFMAPELWRQQEASPRSDLFALGMTFFVAATGQLPYRPGTTMAEVVMAVCDERPFADARDLRPDLPPGVAAVLRRLLAKRPEDRFESAVELVTALVAAGAEGKARRVPGSGPYRGLSSFSASERDVFFGREGEVVEVLERLRVQSGLVLVGPSGSGKSSLAHAGVVPAIEEGALGGGLVYRAARFEPRARPLASLAAALGRALSSPEEAWLGALRSSPEGLGQRVRGALPPGVGLVLMIDQLEELATLAADPGEVALFARALGALTEVTAPELRVLATLRADLMDRLFSQEALRPLLTRGFYPVRPLLGEGLRRALVGPAQAAGYSFEDPALIEQILGDVARSSAGLPLMSFAMAAWWQGRDEDRKLLPTAAWKALGGVAGALARHGDGVLDGLGREERDAAEQILLRLVSADGTRARAPRSVLLDPAAMGPGAERALARLLQSKLLHEAGHEIELAHEALIQQWPTLQRLLRASGEDRAFRERVASAAREWDAQGRPAGALWTDDQALRLLRWFEVTPSTLDQNELAFLEAVRSRLLRRRFLLRAGVFSAVSLAFIFALVTKRSERDLQERLGDASRRAAQLEVEYRKAEGARLRSVAERQLEEDPTRALATAFESYEKSPGPHLDILAWRARYRGIAFPLPLHRKGARSVQFSPQGDWIVSAGGDGALFFQATGAPDTALVRPSRDDRATPSALAFSPQGLAIGSSIGEILLARPPTFSPVVLARCEPEARQIAWVQGAILARCGTRLLRVTPEPRHQEPLPLANVLDLDATPDGSLAIALHDHTISLLQGQTSQETSAPGATLAALSPRGDRVAFADHQGHLRWATIREGKIGPWKELPEKLLPPVSTLSLGPDGALLAVGADRQGRLWLGERSHSVETGGSAHAWSEHHRVLLLAGPSEEVLLLSLVTGEVVGRLQGASAAITAIDASGQGTWALVASEDGATRGYHLEDNLTWVSRGPAPARPTACAVSPDGAAVACGDAQGLTLTPVRGSVGGLKEGRVEPVDAAPTLVALGARGEVTSWAAPERWTLRGRAERGLAAPTALALSPKHGALGGRGPGPLLRLVPIEGGAARDLALPEAPSALAFSPDGARLAVAVPGHPLRILDPSTGAPLREAPLPPLAGSISALAFSEDGSSLAVGSSGGGVALLLERKAEAQIVGKFPTGIRCLAWSQGERALALATSDHHRFALDVESRQFFPTGHGAAPVAGCARSPVADRFSYVLADGTVLLRPIDTAPLTMSKPPEPPLDPRTMPLNQWAGLPKGWR